MAIYLVGDLKAEALGSFGDQVEAAARPPPSGGAASSEEPQPNRQEVQVMLPRGIWTQYLSFTELNGVRYWSEGNGTWSPAAAH